MNIDFCAVLIVCIVYHTMKYVRFLKPYLFPFDAFVQLTLTVNVVLTPDRNVQDGNVDINENEIFYIYKLRTSVEI